MCVIRNFMKLPKIQEFHVIPKGLTRNYVKLLKPLENFTHIY